MQEHPSTEQLRQYQRRTLAPDLFLSIQGHVSACAVCSELCGGTSGTKEDYENLLTALMPDPYEEEYHLTEAELAGYAQGSLDEVASEMAAGHVELCAECAREVEELRAAAAADEKSHGAWTNFPAFLTSMPRMARAASLALLVLGLALAAIFVLRTRNDRTAQSPEKPVEGTSINANQPEAITSPTQTPQPSIVNNGQQDETAEVERLPPHLRRVVQAALTTQRLERPAVLGEGLDATKGTLLGDGGDGSPFRLLSPVGKVIQSSRPTFSWKPLAGANGYVVTIADKNLDEVATSGTLTQTAWTAPKPLKRGGIYSWQVTAYKDGKAITSPVMPAPPAKFVVLDRAGNDELNSVRRSLPNYHLGLGVLYTRAGLLDEAEREFQAELKTNPRSTVARKLLQSLRDMKR